MNKEEIEYTIKTDRNTGEIVFSRGDYLFKQWGLGHEIIDLIEYLQQENKQLKQKVADYSFKLASYSCEETYIREINELKEKIDKLNKQITEYQDEIFARDNNWYDMQD